VQEGQSTKTRKAKSFNALTTLGARELFALVDLHALKVLVKQNVHIDATIGEK
jgi:hypothetical protein